MYARNFRLEYQLTVGDAGVTVVVTVATVVVVGGAAAGGTTGATGTTGVDGVRIFTASATDIGMCG
jgi:hypothetical protein